MPRRKQGRDTKLSQASAGPPTPKIPPHTRDAFVRAVGLVASRHRAKLEELKARAGEIERPDFLWHYLLQSFATMGNSRGWEGLIGTPENYAQVIFDVVIALPPAKRLAHLDKTLRIAKVRMPAKKAAWFLSAVQRIVAGGGLPAMRQRLLDAPGRGGKIAFLRRFAGIGEKYGRNIMMDVFHPDFHDAIAVDIRIDKVLRVGGVALSRYEEKEAFLVEVAAEASLLPWELDRTLHHFTDETIAALNGLDLPAVSGHALAEEALQLLDAQESAGMTDRHRAAVRSAIAAAVRSHRGATLGDP